MTAIKGLLPDGAVMRVLLDARKLGLSYQGLRTGIHRVVYHLACGLASSGECELQLCTPVELASTHRYCREDAFLANVPLAGHPARHLWSEHAYRINTLVERGGLGGRAWIPARKACNFMLKRATRKYGIADAGLLARTHIYHSGSHGIPEELRGYKHIRKCQTVYDIAPVAYPQFFQDAQRAVHAEMLRNLHPEDWTFCISKYTRDALCEHLKRDLSRSVVTPLAADRTIFYPCIDQERIRQVRLKYALPDEPYILSLSTLEPRKNIDHVIRCYVRLMEQQKLEGLHLVLAGGKGWTYDKIFAEIDCHPKVKQRIRTIGYVADEDMSALYSGALVFTYLSFYEGFGLPPLEAMQCGAPVITSNTSSLPEVVGEAGILLDPCDEDSLCQALLTLYNDADLRRRLSQQSLERSGLFSWERFVQANLDGYKVALT